MHFLSAVAFCLHFQDHFFALHAAFFQCSKFLRQTHKAPTQVYDLSSVSHRTRTLWRNCSHCVPHRAQTMWRVCLSSLIFWALPLFWAMPNGAHDDGHEHHAGYNTMPEKRPNQISSRMLHTVRQRNSRNMEKMEIRTSNKNNMYVRHRWLQCQTEFQNVFQIKEWNKCGTECQIKWRMECQTNVGKNAG